MDNLPAASGSIWSYQAEQTEQQRGNTLPVEATSDSSSRRLSSNHSDRGLNHRSSTSVPLAQRTVSNLSCVRSERIKRCVAEIKKAFSLQQEFEAEEARLIEERFGNFYISNDFTHQSVARSHPLDFCKMIKALEEKAETREEKLQVALMVGESSLIGCLPELSRHCDIVLNVDINPLVLNLQTKRFELLQGCNLSSGEEKFSTTLFDHLRDNLKSEQKKAVFDNQFLLSEYGLHQYWPFSSEQRLAQVKEAANRVQVVPVCLNLFCKDSQSTLARILRDNEATVNAINLTNVFEYYIVHLAGQGVDPEAIDTKPSELFKDLPVSQNAWVHCSRHLEHPCGSTLKSTEDNWLFLDQVFESDLDRAKKRW